MSHYLVIVKPEGKALIRCEGGNDGTGTWYYAKGGGKWMEFYSEAAAASAAEVIAAPYCKPLILSAGALMDLLVMDEMVDA